MPRRQRHMGEAVHSRPKGTQMPSKSENIVITVPTGRENFSSPSFHIWAGDYYKCVQDFRAPDRFSPVPYALLCRAIELELKSRHLSKAHLSGGAGQEKIRTTFGHDLIRLYESLEPKQKNLTAAEVDVLRAASVIYKHRKGFDYIQPADAATAYSRFPDLAVLDAVAKKLLEAER
jgi:hypothetical protein